jgi:hypothetical protein
MKETALIKKSKDNTVETKLENVLGVGSVETIRNK